MSHDQKHILYIFLLHFKTQCNEKKIHIHTSMILYWYSNWLLMRVVNVMLKVLTNIQMNWEEHINYEQCI